MCIQDVYWDLEVTRSKSAKAFYRLVVCFWISLPQLRPLPFSLIYMCALLTQHLWARQVHYGPCYSHVTLTHSGIDEQTNCSIEWMLNFTFIKKKVIQFQKLSAALPKVFKDTVFTVQVKSENSRKLYTGVYFEDGFYSDIPFLVLPNFFLPV